MTTARAATTIVDRARKLGHGDIIDATESPLEALLAATWISRYGAVHLTVQQPVGCYRTDLALHNVDRSLAVEVDGYDFHEVTPRQQADDRRRERYLQRSGWLVVRFAGREVWQDPGGCADELAVFLWGDDVSPVVVAVGEILAAQEANTQETR